MVVGLFSAVLAVVAPVERLELPKTYTDEIVAAGRRTVSTQREEFFCLVGGHVGSTARVTRLVKPVQGTIRVQWFDKEDNWTVLDQNFPDDLKPLVDESLSMLGTGKPGDMWAIVVRAACPSTSIADLHTHPWGNDLINHKPSTLDLDIWRRMAEDDSYKGPYLHLILHPFYGKFRLSGWYFGPDGVRVLSHEDVAVVN